MEVFNVEKQTESAEERNSRFADGRITEAEIRAHWANPEKPLFEHEIIRERNGIESKTHFKMRALTENFKQPLLESIRNSWDKTSFAELQETLDLFFEQKKLDHPALLNVEYYIATDQKDNPFAVTGIYTTDIDGGAGFATRDKLDLSRHNMVARLGWFSVGKEYQGTGVGGFLQEWTENTAKSRGAAIMAIETSDYENEAMARKMYEERGYYQGLNVKEYFGPGRDLFSYFFDAYRHGNTKPLVKHESISDENRQNILSFAKQNYSPDKFKEFEAVLDLIDQQKEEEEILQADSVILRDVDQNIESFAVLYSGVYNNVTFVPWIGSKDKQAKQKILQAIKGVAVANEKYTVIVNQDQKDPELLKNGFEVARKDGIPWVYDNKDENKFLLYTKRL